MTEESKFEKAMQGIENDTDVSFFPTGIDIGWSLKGCGWGHLSFGIRDGKWWADTECMSAESVANIIRNAAPILAEKLLAIEAGEDVIGKGETDRFCLVFGGGKGE